MSELAESDPQLITCATCAAVYPAPEPYCTDVECGAPNPRFHAPDSAGLELVRYEPDSSAKEADEARGADEAQASAESKNVGEAGSYAGQAGADAREQRMSPAEEGPARQSPVATEAERSYTKQEADALEAEIAAFRKLKGHGPIVVVFGMSGHGKTFLNKRLARRNAPRTRGVTTGPTIGTLPGTFTSTITKFFFDDETWTLVIDLAGEDFQAHMRGEDLPEVYPVALEAMDAIIVYMSAGSKWKTDEDMEDRWEGEPGDLSRRSNDMSAIPETIYNKFFHYLQNEVGVNQPGVRKPVFFALSKADRFIRWAQVKANAGHQHANTMQALMDLSPDVLLGAAIAADSCFHASGYVCSHEGQAGITALSHPSYGVDAMFHVLFKMRKAAAAGEDPAILKSLDIAVVNPKGKRSVVSKLDHSLLRYMPRPQGHDPVYFKGKGVLGRILPSQLRAVPPLLVGIACMASLVWFTFQSAVALADSERQNINNKIMSIKGLPPGFAVKAADAWILPPDWDKQLRDDMREGSESFGLIDDYLVGVPVQSPSMMVFLFDSKSLNGKEVKRVFETIKACHTDGKADACGDPAPPVFSSNQNDSTQRVFFYADALYHYRFNRGDPAYLDNVKQALDKFAAKHTDKFGGATGFNENILPHAARFLLLAHATYASSHESEGALVAYGAALERALMPSGTRPAFDDAALSRIGVSRARLARHWLGAELVGEGDEGEMRKALERRLALAGMKLDTTFFHGPEFERLGSSDAFRDKGLACLVSLGILGKQFASPAAGAAATMSTCTLPAMPVETSPLGKFMWERSRLVDRATWTDEGKRTDIDFSTHLGAIIKAVESAEERSTLSAPQKKALTDLKSITDPGSFVLASKHIVYLLLGSLVSGMLAFVLYRWLTLSAALRLRASPYWTDSKEPTQAENAAPDQTS